MPGIEFLAARLEEAGLPVAKLEAMTSGSFNVAGVAALRGGGRVFAKTRADADATNMPNCATSARRAAA